MKFEPSLEWGLLSRLGFLQTLGEILKKCGPSLWMRSTIPIFDKIWSFGKCGPSLEWGLLSRFLTRLGFLQTLRKILKNVGLFFEWGLLSQFLQNLEFWKMLALAWMRFTVPIFDMNRIFANPKENFEKCGSSLWMRFTVPIFDKIKIFANFKENF